MKNTLLINFFTILFFALIYQPAFAFGDTIFFDIDGNVVDKAPIDLDNVEREALQIGHGGVTGTEIVERDPDTLVLEARDDRLGDTQFALELGELRPPAPRPVQSGEVLGDVTELLVVAESGGEERLGGRLHVFGAGAGSGDHRGRGGEGR